MVDMKAIIGLATAALVGVYSPPGMAAPGAAISNQRKPDAKKMALHQTSKTPVPLHYWREMATGIGANAVRAPFGRFLLIQYGPQCLALRITEHTNFRVVGHSEVYTAQYEWFLQTDGSRDFARSNVQHGTGEACEFKGDSYTAAYIRAGSFPVLEWSSSDWIYFTLAPTPVGGYPPGSEQARREKEMRMATTEWVRIEDVKPRQAYLRWLSKTQTEKFDHLGR